MSAEPASAGRKTGNAGRPPARGPRDRNSRQLRSFKRSLSRFWVFSPEKLWLLSIGLWRDGHWAMAFALKQLNSLLYHNSLAPGANVSPDVYLGHNSLGIVVSKNVTIGRHVAIWQNVTLTAGRPERDASAAPSERESPSAEPVRRSHIIVEDHVAIGANVVVIPRRGRTLRIGWGAQIGAGVVLTDDVPPRAVVYSNPPRVLLREEHDGAHDQHGVHDSKGES
jgi:serine O-acetyltransferase